MITNKPLISVIIPVYNVEKYLRECLDCLLAQTYQKLEIILVDDGSTDASGQICDNYALKDNRIKVFHQVNAGASTARNYGLACAEGELISFVDSDDTLDLNTYEIAVKLLVQHRADWIMWTYEHAATYPIKEGLNEGKEYQQLILNSLIARGFGPALFKQIYKKEIFDKYQIQCPPQLRNYEDFAVVMRYAFVAKNIYYAKGYHFYHHRVNPTSIVQSYDKNIEKNIVLQLAYFQDLFRTSHLPYEPYLTRWSLWQLLRIFQEEGKKSSGHTWSQKKVIFIRFFALSPIQEQLNKLTCGAVLWPDFIVLLCAKHHFYMSAYCIFQVICKLKKNRFVNIIRKHQRGKISFNKIK